MVNEREADFVIADPEDMYVAANLNNEDFLVFAQIRTVEEPEGCIDFITQYTHIAHFNCWYIFRS